jgi:hypothetical protein
MVERSLPSQHEYLEVVDSIEEQTVDVLSCSCVLRL